MDLFFVGSSCTRPNWIQIQLRLKAPGPDPFRLYCPDLEQGDVAGGLKASNHEASEQAGGVHDCQGGAVGEAGVGHPQHHQHGGEEEVAGVGQPVQDCSGQEAADQRSDGVHHKNEGDAGDGGSYKIPGQKVRTEL